MKFKVGDIVYHKDFLESSSSMKILKIEESAYFWEIVSNPIHNTSTSFEWMEKNCFKCPILNSPLYKVINE